MKINLGPLASMAIGIASCLCPSMLQAQDNFPIGVGLKIGTTGVGIELSTELTESINLRGAYNWADINVEIETTEINYDTDFNKSSLSLMLDWHPNQGGFRVSGGFFSHFDNTINIVAKPSSGSYLINGTPYDATQLGTLSGDISFKKMTPYIGIGWGNALNTDNNFGFTVDLGVLAQDTPDVSLVATDCILIPSLCTQLNADILNEIDELDEDLKDLKLWPVINVGFSFHF